MKRGLCTVVWLSDRDHLFTGESEGCEGPFERDGTTRQSRGRKWHVWRTRMRRRNFPRDPMVFTVGTWGWRLQTENPSPEMDLGGGKLVGYEVWLYLA
ncbi:hypothetical protein CRG98_022606 [Punica granatum]|uniref:Uncharacterized protein n=1 Tax=Punica granatum TaxID=22663 RepID=A0A2I0JM56_PUNGR|nr:hypothetical protein CRG98_022606 [Punica granatum]